MSTLSDQVIFEALKVLQKKGGTMRGSDVSKTVGETIPFDQEALRVHERTGNVKWWACLQFRSIGAVKAGFLIKKRGVWSITPEGEKALSLGMDGLAKAIHERYWTWKNQQPQDIADSESDSEMISESSAVTLEQTESQALEGIRNYLDSKNPYEFQDFVAALLRGMGYFTPFVAPKGRDGGIDIIAYRDPLGTVSPRIKVQVKHRNGKAGSPEITQLHGLLQTDAVGIFVSSGGFSSDAILHARNLARHIELIDLDRLIELWIQFYEKLSDEDKIHLPLTPVYFLTPENQ